MLYSSAPVGRPMRVLTGSGVCMCLAGDSGLDAASMWLEGSPPSNTREAKLLSSFSCGALQSITLDIPAAVARKTALFCELATEVSEGGTLCWGAEGRSPVTFFSHKAGKLPSYLHPHRSHISVWPGCPCCCAQVWLVGSCASCSLGLGCRRERAGLAVCVRRRLGDGASNRAG